MRICNCGKTQVKLASNRDGPHYYLIMHRNGSKASIPYTLHKTTDRIEHNHQVALKIDCCTKTMVMKEHIK